MNDKTIRAIYYGDPCPADSCFDQNSEYAQKLTEQVKLCQKLEEALPSSMKETLDNILQIDSEIAELSSLEAFVKGFSLGMRIAVEALND